MQDIKKGCLLNAKKSIIKSYSTEGVFLTKEEALEAFKKYGITRLSAVIFLLLIFTATSSPFFNFALQPVERNITPNIKNKQRSEQAELHPA